MTTFNPQEIEHFHAYLDGELSSQERAAFEAELQQGPKLRTALAQERKFRAGFRAHIQQTRAPVFLQAAIQLNQKPDPATPPWQQFLAWWQTPKAMRPSVALAGVFLWSVFLGGVVWGVSARTPVAIQQFITKHELYFEGIPSLDMTGTHEEVNAYIEQQAPFEAKAPDLGSDWWVAGVRLDDFQQRRMIDILYFKESGLDASLSIFDPQQHTFPGDNKVSYGGQVYYVTDDGWHRTIVWTSNGVGYALVGNLVIPADDLFNMATVIRHQFD
jgi:anti-sigma factor RsiW